MSHGSSPSAALFFETVGLRVGVQLARSWPVAATPARNVMASATPASGRKVAGTRSARNTLRSTGPRTGRALASPPRQGARVPYRQGRGTFNAHVLRVDAAHGTAVLEREPDLKRVVRPLGKIYAPK